ncbi:MAG: ABC transporter substrate-binding protein [Trueperaceae bacterium]|nr:ABC transporter substrate-binding protein [Trueperaceae bacterium]
MKNPFRYLLSLMFVLLLGSSFASGTLIGGFDVGPGGDPQVIPFHNFAGNTWLAKIYTPLVMMTPDFGEATAEGSLSESWEMNEAATIWTFHLRDGVKWHDGEALTAQDVKFTAELISAPDAVVKRTLLTAEGQPTNIQGWTEYNAGSADEISGIVAADDTTVEFHLIEPDPRFYDSIRWFYILPEHAIDFSPSEFQSTDWWFSKAIGTGPFKLSAYEKDQYMELVPNEYYWDGAPKLDKLINRYFTDEAAAVLALESGDIDFTYVGGDIAAKFEGDPDYVVYQGPSFVTNLFNFNYQRDAWKDKRVRQAFMYGIDRESILRDVFNGTAQATPCNDPYPTFWPEDANYYPYDPAKARQLLDEAAADGINVRGGNYEIPTYYTGQLPKDILTVMQANLADIGVNANPLFIDVPSWRVKVDDNADFDFTYRGYGAGPAFIATNWYTEGNQWGIDDPNYATLVDAMNKAFTPEEYKAARTDLCRYQNEDATFAYFWVSTRYGVAKAGIENFYYFPAPGGGPYVDHAELWDKGE